MQPSRNQCAMAYRIRISLWNLGWVKGGGGIDTFRNHN